MSRTHILILANAVELAEGFNRGAALTCDGIECLAFGHLVILLGTAAAHGILSLACGGLCVHACYASHLVGCIAAVANLTAHAGSLTGVFLVVALGEHIVVAGDILIAEVEED